jgi:hypothetical protein
MIRTVALGFICLAGVGAIAAAAKKSTPPPPEVVMPVVSGNKTDRLPLTIKEDKPTDAEKVDVVYVQPSEQGQASPPPPVSERTGSYTTSRRYFSSLAGSTLC